MSVTGTGTAVQKKQIAIGVGDESSPGGGFLWPNQPNIVDFLAFLGNSAQIPAAALPPTSPWPQYALTQATGLVIDCPAPPIAIQYTLAAYNCATHILLSITPDVAGQNYFSTQRSNKGFSLVNPSTGLVAASSDESTSATLIAPEWAARLQVDQLDFYKTPWGRAYLAYNQKYGSTIWGLT